MPAALIFEIVGPEEKDIRLFENRDGGFGIADADDERRTVAGTGRDESVSVIHIDALTVKELCNGQKAPRTIVHFDAEYIRFGNREAHVFESLEGNIRLINNQANDPEIAGFRNHQGPDIHAGTAERFGDLGKLSGFVFRKDGNLFDCLCHD